MRQHLERARLVSCDSRPTRKCGSIFESGAWLVCYSTPAPTAEPTATPTPEPTPEPIIKLLKETSHNAEKGIISQYIYEYDSNGNLLKKSSVDKSGNLKSYELYEYNDAGQETLYGSYFADGVEIRREETDLAKDGSDLAWMEYTYDDHGRLIRRFQNDIMDWGLLHENCSYEYDENGRPTKKIEYNSSDEIKAISYMNTAKSINICKTIL